MEVLGVYSSERKVAVFVPPVDAAWVRIFVMSKDRCTGRIDIIVEEDGRCSKRVDSKKGYRFG